MNNKHPRVGWHRDLWCGQCKKYKARGWFRRGEPAVYHKTCNTCSKRLPTLEDAIKDKETNPRYPCFVAEGVILFGKTEFREAIWDRWLDPCGIIWHIHLLSQAGVTRELVMEKYKVPPEVMTKIRQALPPPLIPIKERMDMQDQVRHIAFHVDRNTKVAVSGDYPKMCCGMGCPLLTITQHRATCKQVREILKYSAIHKSYLRSEWCRQNEVSDLQKE